MLRSNPQRTPGVPASVAIACIPAASNPPTIRSFFSANYPSPIPAFRSIPASRCSPATATRRSPHANSQVGVSFPSPSSSFCRNRAHLCRRNPHRRHPRPAALLFPLRQGPRILQSSDDSASEMRRSAPSRSALPVIGWLFLLWVYGCKGSSGLVGGPPGVGLSPGIFWEAGVKLGVRSEFLYFGALTYPCT